MKRWYVLFGALVVWLLLASCGSDSISSWAMAMFQENVGEHEKALARATKLVENRIDSMDGALTSNLTTSRYFDPEEAAEDILKLSRKIHDNDNLTNCLAARGFLFCVIGEYDLGISDFENAMKAGGEPDLLLLEPLPSETLRFCHALALWQRGEKRQAISGLDNITRVNQRCHQAWFYMGVIKDELGQRIDAIGHIEYANYLKPNPVYGNTLAYLKGHRSGEVPYCSFLIAFFSNREPLNRPYGYIWPLVQDTK